MVVLLPQFGVDSASLRYVISCLVSCERWLCKTVDSFDVSVEQFFLFLLVFQSLLLFVNSSHHVAQSFSLQEIEPRDALVSCHCVVFFLH